MIHRIKLISLNGASLFLLVLLFHCCLNLMNGYKILGVVHMTSKSHFIYGSALMKELARKGHDVTVISPFPLKTQIANYTDVPVTEVFNVFDDRAASNLLKTRNQNIIKSLLSFYQVGLQITETVLKAPSVQALMHSNQTFDVVICEVFLSEALYGLAEHFKAPLVGLGTFGAILWNTDMVGSPSPPSYVPSALLHFTDHMTLPQRIINLAFLTFERIFTDIYYLPRQEALYREHFPHAKLTMLEVRRNTALVLLNQHVSLTFPRPYMPNHIEVGGLHINRKRQPLPVDLKQFLDEAKDGAIYFSMGSNLKSKDLPVEKREAILETFRSLKQRVLWKFEDSDLPNKPESVIIRSWFPQDDILAHPNVLAFITHGGLLSTTESIYHAKPFIGIPIFGDQFLNTARAEANGYGIMFDYNELTTATFTAVIKRILEDPSFTERVRDMSARYRDQPMQPLTLATFWIEHVARHKGATYMHCAGLDLNFWQYHSLDSISILCGGVALLLALFAILVCSVCRLLGRVLFAEKTRQAKLKRKKQ